MRELSDPLTDEDKAWLRSRNMPVPGEDGEPARAQVIQVPEETLPPAGGEGETLPEDYNDWTVAQLKEELGPEGRGLPVSGTKAELVERLQEDDANQE